MFKKQEESKENVEYINTNQVKQLFWHFLRSLLEGEIVYWALTAGVKSVSIQENVAENSLGKRKFSECLIWEEEEIGPTYSIWRVFYHVVKVKPDGRSGVSLLAMLLWNVMYGSNLVRKISVWYRPINFFELYYVIHF